MSSLIGWKYRKKINITGQSGAGTNYQLLLKVGESAGSSGADFNLGGLSAKFPSDKNDGGDLRFTLSDGIVLLDFWVEEVSGTAPNRVAKIWVKVLDDLGTNKSIYCYFGNISAYNYSNGDNTFVFFDDFNSDTSANYVVVGSGTKQYDSTNKVLKQTNTSQVQNWIICSVDSLPNNYVYQADVKIVNDPPNRNHAGLATDFSTSAVTGYRLTHLDTVFPLSKWSTGAETSIGSFSDGGIYADNKWLTERVYRNRTTGLLKYEVTDGITTVSGSYTDTTHTTGHLGFHSYGCEVWYDNVLVRNYTSPEPVFGSAEREETLVSPRRIIFINASSSSLSFSATLSEYPLPFMALQATLETQPKHNATALQAKLETYIWRKERSTPSQNWIKEETHE